MFIRHILVATDFSSRSQSALRYAIHLARSLSVDIDLLHVIPAPALSRTVINAYLERALPRPDEALVTDAKHKLERLIADEPHAGVRITTLVEAGDPAATVVRVASELPSDLVVLATHARTGFSEILLGSVAHSVITCAPCPVITLRGDEYVSRNRDKMET